MKRSKPMKRTAFKTKPKKRKLSRPIEQQTKPALEREAWKQFSRYVRLRDSEWRGDGWYGKCITCAYNRMVVRADGGFERGWDAGHFVGRSNKVIKFDEENVNLQCKYRCNNLRSGEYEKYRLALGVKYGDGTAEKLENLARSTTYYKFSREELLQIIHDSKEQVAWYLENR